MRSAVAHVAWVVVLYIPAPPLESKPFNLEPRNFADDRGAPLEGNRQSFGRSYDECAEEEACSSNA